MFIAVWDHLLHSDGYSDDTDLGIHRIPQGQQDLSRNCPQVARDIIPGADDTQGPDPHRLD